MTELIDTGNRRSRFLVDVKYAAGGWNWVGTWQDGEDADRMAAGINGSGSTRTARVREVIDGEYLGSDGYVSWHPLPDQVVFPTQDHPTSHSDADIMARPESQPVNFWHDTTSDPARTYRETLGCGVLMDRATLNQTAANAARFYAEDPTDENHAVMVAYAELKRENDGWSAHIHDGAPEPTPAAKTYAAALHADCPDCHGTGTVYDQHGTGSDAYREPLGCDCQDPAPPADGSAEGATDAELDAVFSFSDLDIVTRPEGQPAYQHDRLRAVCGGGHDDSAVYVDECDRCNGFGEVAATRQEDRNGWPLGGYVTCPKCNGQKGPTQTYRVAVYIDVDAANADTAHGIVLQALDGIDSWNNLITGKDAPISAVCIANPDEVTSTGD